MKNLQPKGRFFFKMNGSWRKLVTVHTQHFFNLEGKYACLLHGIREKLKKFLFR